MAVRKAKKKAVPKIVWPDRTFPCIERVILTGQLPDVKKPIQLSCRSGDWTYEDGCIHNANNANYLLDVVVGVLCKHKSTKGFVLLKSGDLSEELIEVDDDLKFHGKSVLDFCITTSFECIARLLFGIDDKLSVSTQMVQKVCLLLASDDVKLLDFTTDKTIKLSAAEKKIYQSNKSQSIATIRSLIKNNHRGFTLIDSMDGDLAEWHQSATILVSYKGKYYLLGQDEGTFFGCELATRPETIKQALLDLEPPEARKKKGVLRQGEWFAIPVPKQQVPKIEDCIGTSQNFNLPRETDSSNVHCLSIDELESIELDGIRISTLGDIYAFGGKLVHSEHSDVYLPANKWFIFKRNTAIRSVSQDGVD